MRSQALRHPISPSKPCVQFQPQQQQQQLLLPGGSSFESATQSQRTQRAKTLLLRLYSPEPCTPVPTLSRALSTQAMLSAMTGRQRSTSRSRMTADTKRPSCRDTSLLLLSDGLMARLLHTCMVVVGGRLRAARGTIR